MCLVQFKDPTGVVCLTGLGSEVKFRCIGCFCVVVSEHTYAQPMPGVVLSLASYGEVHSSKLGSTKTLFFFQFYVGLLYLSRWHVHRNNIQFRKTSGNFT